MKLTKITIIAMVVSIFSGYAQNVASTSTLTSGGSEAGTSGTGNTFYGYRAGQNSIGTQNTFIGNQAGRNNTNGSANLFVGNYAGTNNRTGASNVFIGTYSGQNNYSGSGNVYIGENAGGESETSNYNTFIGFNAGGESTGSHNVLIGNHAGYYENLDNQLRIGNGFLNTPLVWGDFALDQLKLNGKVGIGNGFADFPTTAGSVNVSNYSLFVKGGILTEEVRVNLQFDWADYVFLPDYKLKTLEEVENYIKENGHLENVPSATQVKEEGIELGEMVKIQQEKIEELTLYLIQQNKEIQELKNLLYQFKNNQKF